MNTTTINTSQEKTFFDLHVKGLGYVNRVRAVSPKKGPNYIACTIAALRGEAGEKLYTKFDVRITGAEAERVIEMLGEDINAKAKNGEPLNKVLIGFRVGDIYPETFQYTREDLKGQTGIVIKGRLLKIDWAKVNGEDRYKAPAKQEADLSETSAATGTEG
jgi:hypothetical protein